MALCAQCRSGAVALLLALGAGSAAARDLFSVNVDVTTPTAASGSASFNTVTDLANSLQTGNLQAIVPAYTNNSAAMAALNIRGVAASASFAANSTTLTFAMPAAGINVSFTGATRDDSAQDLLNFLTSSGGSLTTRLLQQMVASSPVDPVAGNPMSLQNSMAAADFAIGTGIGLNGEGVPPPTAPGAARIAQPNLFTAAGEIGFANSGGFTSEIFTLPLRYTIALADPRYAVTLDLPITYINTQGASSFYGSFGVALRVPVLTNWYLTPTLRVGAAGSVDLGAAAVQYEGGLASRYDIYVHDLDITIGNAISVNHTGGLSVGSVNVNYDLTNELFTNGVQVEGSLPYTMFGHPTSWQAYVADTAITGSAVYVSNYVVMGITAGTRHPLNSQDWNTFRVGLAVTLGARFDAFQAGFTYRF
jgi:hypothetical protein